MFLIGILWLYHCIHASICRIDAHHVIKVSDFGLSEDIYSKNYFQQGRSKTGGPVKLPVKWMAPESLTDNYFSEMSDVVRPKQI